MAEIKISNLDWFATLPEMQQNILHQNYPTDELKQGWFDLGKPFVYEGLYYDTNNPKGEFFDPWGAMTNIRDIPTKFVNFEINPKLGVLGDFWMERNVPLEEYKQDPNPANYTSRVELPYYMKTLPLYFFPPTAPFAAGLDIAEGIHDFNPAQVAMSALGVNQISRTLQKALAFGGITLTPQEADAKIISKALEYIKGIATKAKGQPINSTAESFLKSLEETVGNSGKVKGVEFRAIRDHLSELNYDMNKKRPLVEIVDDINHFNYFDDIVTETIDSPYGPMLITKIKPKDYSKSSKENILENRRSRELSKSTNVDAMRHYPVDNYKGIISHTLLDEKNTDPTVMKILEFQSDMSSHARKTGFRGTPENKNYIDKTTELLNAAFTQRADKGFGVVRQDEWFRTFYNNPNAFLENELASNKYSRALYEAAISHPNFPKKVFDDWKDAEPKLWAKMQDDIANNSEIDMSVFSTWDDWDRTRGNVENPFQILINAIEEIQPITDANDWMKPKIRQAPPSHPLLLKDNWLHYEIANVLEEATSNPNIKQIVLPNAEEAVARYSGAPGTEAYLRRIYDKEVPRILKKLGVEVITGGKTGKYASQFGENQYANFLNAVDDVDERGKLIEIFSDEGLDMSEGIVRWVQENVLGVGAANAKNTNTASLLLEALKSGQLGKGYLDTLETIAQEVIRVSPKKEKAINKYLEIIYSADVAATEIAKFKLEPFSNAVENMAKGMQGDEPGRVIRTMEDSVAGYADTFALKFEDILNNDLTKLQIKELEDAGLIIPLKDPRSVIEVTPKLIDKIQNVGVPGI